MQGDVRRRCAARRICSLATRTGITFRGCRSSRRSTTPGNKFFVYARQRDDTHLRAVFASQTDSPYFPVPFENVQADVAFRELVEGARFEIGPVKVSCTRLNHPWIAMAYRLDCDGALGLLRDRHRAVPRHPHRAGIHPPAAQARRSAEAGRRRQAARDARRRRAFVRRRRPRDLRHAVHARGVRRQAALGPLVSRGRDRDLARGRSEVGGAVPPRARAHRRSDRRAARLPSQADAGPRPRCRRRRHGAALGSGQRE